MLLQVVSLFNHSDFMKTFSLETSTMEVELQSLTQLALQCYIVFKRADRWTILFCFDYHTLSIKDTTENIFLKRSLDDIYKVSHSSPMGYHWIIFHNYGKREGRWVHCLDWRQRHRQRTQGSFEKNDAAGWVNFMQALQLFLIIFSQQNIFRILSLWQSFVWPLSLSYWLFSTTIPSASMSITDEKIQRKILLTFFGQNSFHVIFDHNLRSESESEIWIWGGGSQHDR